MDVDFRSREVWVEPYVVQLGPQLPWGMPHRIEPGYWTTVNDSAVVAVLGDGQRVPPANSTPLWTEGERVCIACRNARVERLALERARIADEQERLLEERRLAAARPLPPASPGERVTPRSLAGLVASFVVVAALGALVLGYGAVAAKGWLPDADGLSRGPLGHGEAPYVRLIVVAGALCGGAWLLLLVILDWLYNRREAARFLGSYERWRLEHARWRQELHDLREQNESLRVSPAGGQAREPLPPSAADPPPTAPVPAASRILAAAVLPCLAVAGGFALIDRNLGAATWRPIIGSGYELALPVSGEWSAGRNRYVAGTNQRRIAGPGRNVVTVYQTPAGHAPHFRSAGPVSNAFESIGGIRVRGGIVTYRLNCGPCKGFVARAKRFGEIAILADRPTNEAEKYARLVARSLKPR